MFSFTSAHAVELLTASGSQPTTQWVVRGKVSRAYDPALRSYALTCDGGPTTRLTLPKDERKSLALTHRVLVLQLALSRERPFSFEVTISDAAGTRRRFAFSTSLREPISTALHTRLPLVDLPRGAWLNLVIDLAELLEVFFGTVFARLDGLAIGPSCRVRRVFALRTFRLPPSNSGAQAAEDASVSTAELVHLLSGDAPGSTMPRAWAYGEAAEAITLAFAARTVALSAGSPLGSGAQPSCVSPPAGSASAGEGGHASSATPPPWARDGHTPQRLLGCNSPLLPSRSNSVATAGGGGSGAGGAGGGGLEGGATWSSSAGGCGSSASAGASLGASVRKLRTPGYLSASGAHAAAHSNVNLCSGSALIAGSSVGLPGLRSAQQHGGASSASTGSGGASRSGTAAPHTPASALSPGAAGAAGGGFNSSTPGHSREGTSAARAGHRPSGSAQSAHGRAGRVSPIQTLWSGGASGGIAAGTAAGGSPRVAIGDLVMGAVPGGGARESTRYSGVPQLGAAGGGVGGACGAPLAPGAQALHGGSGAGSPSGSSPAARSPASRARCAQLQISAAAAATSPEVGSGGEACAGLPGAAGGAGACGSAEMGLRRRRLRELESSLERSFPGSVERSFPGGGKAGRQQPRDGGGVGTACSPACASHAHTPTAHAHHFSPHALPQQAHSALQDSGSATERSARAGRKTRHASCAHTAGGLGGGPAGGLAERLGGAGACGSAGAFGCGALSGLGGSGLGDLLLRSCTQRGPISMPPACGGAAGGSAGRAVGLGLRLDLSRYGSGSQATGHANNGSASAGAASSGSGSGGLSGGGGGGGGRGSPKMDAGDLMLLSPGLSTLPSSRQTFPAPVASLNGSPATPARRATIGGGTAGTAAATAGAAPRAGAGGAGAAAAQGAAAAVGARQPQRLRAGGLRAVGSGARAHAETAQPGGPRQRALPTFAPSPPAPGLGTNGGGVAGGGDSHESDSGEQYSNSESGTRSDAGSDAGSDAAAVVDEDVVDDFGRGYAPHRAQHALRRSDQDGEEPLWTFNVASSGLGGGGGGRAVGAEDGEDEDAMVSSFSFTRQQRIGLSAAVGAAQRAPQPPQQQAQQPAEDLGTPTDDEGATPRGSGRLSSPRRAPWAAASDAGSDSARRGGHRASHRGSRAGADEHGESGADEFEMSTGFEDKGVHLSCHAGNDDRVDFSCDLSCRPDTASRPQTAYSRPQTAYSRPQTAYSPRSHGDDDADMPEGSGRRLQRARLSDDDIGGGGGNRVNYYVNHSSSNSLRIADSDAAQAQAEAEAEALRAALLSAAARDSERVTRERRGSGTAGRRSSGGSGGHGGADSGGSGRRLRSSHRKSSPRTSNAHSASHASAADDESYGRALDADVLIGSRLQSPTCPEEAAQPHGAIRTSGARSSGSGGAWQGTAPVRPAPAQRDIFSPLVIPPSTVSERQANAMAAPALGEPHYSVQGGAQVASLGRETEEDDVVDLLYDPTLNCYYEPRTGKYYELSI